MPLSGNVISFFTMHNMVGCVAPISGERKKKSNNILEYLQFRRSLKPPMYLDFSKDASPIVNP